MRSPDLRVSAARVRIVRVALLLVLLGLSARVAHLAVLDPRASERGRIQLHTSVVVAPERGRILDRFGADLALTLDAPSVYAQPSLVGDRAGTARALSRVLGSDAAELAKRLDHDGRFVFLQRWIEPGEAEQVEALGLRGIGVLQEPRRAYPYGELASRLIGFANIDGEGVRGVEQMEDDWLRGIGRRVPVERDGDGRLLARAGLDPHAHAGGDLRLTLDAVLQADAEAALAGALTEHRARGGFVVALDPRSGDVLALAEAPGFDPNRFRELDYDATRSRAFLDAFEPGSTLKMFTVAAALEHGDVEPGDRIDCRPGSFAVPGLRVRDHHEQGILDVGGVLQISSNIGAARIGHRLGPRAHREALVRFGFGRPTGSGFPHESRGLLRDWRDWRPADHATISYGQGINVTPIQLAAAVAALANDGVWLRPRLVAARRAPGGDWHATPPASSQRAVSSETARQVMAMLERVPQEGGTGRRAAIPGVRVAGKTGTAQRLDPRTKQYVNRYDAWFAGVVPADDPQLVVVAMLEAPRGLHTGGAVAAPLFAHVATTQLARLGVPIGEPDADIRVAAAEAPAAPDAHDPKPAPGTAAPPPTPPGSDPVDPGAPSRVAELPRLGDRVLLPDLRGLTLEEVRALAAAAALELDARGHGLAVAQDPEPGTILAGTRKRLRVRFARSGAEI